MSNVQTTLLHLYEDLEDGVGLFGQDDVREMRATRSIRVEDGWPSPEDAVEWHPLAEGHIPALPEPLMVVDREGAVFMRHLPVEGHPIGVMSYVIYMDVKPDLGVFMRGFVQHVRTESSKHTAFRLFGARYAMRRRGFGWAQSDMTMNIGQYVDAVIRNLPGFTIEQHSLAETFLHDFKNNVETAVCQIARASQRGEISLTWDELPPPDPNGVFTTLSLVGIMGKMSPGGSA